MAKNKQPKPIVFDLGCACDHWDPYDALMEWKEDNPNGKVTLFAIPKRCSTGFLKKYRDLDWVDIAVHGWWYQTMECLAWTDEDTIVRLKWCEDNGFTKGFRAPGWLMSREVIDGCNKAGFWISGHHAHMDMWQPEDRIYIYNRRRRADTWKSAHGNADTPLLGLETIRGSEFKFVRDVVEVHG